MLRIAQHNCSVRNHDNKIKAFRILDYSGEFWLMTRLDFESYVLLTADS